MRTILATYTKDDKRGEPLGGALVEIADDGPIVPLVREQSAAMNCASDGYIHWHEIPPQALGHFAAIPLHQWLTLADLRRHGLG